MAQQNMLTWTMDARRLEHITCIATGAKTLIEPLFLLHVFCSELQQVMLSDMLEFSAILRKASLSTCDKAAMQNIAASDVHRGGHQAGEQCEANAGQADHIGFQ